MYKCLCVWEVNPNACTTHTYGPSDVAAAVMSARAPGHVHAPKTSPWTDVGEVDQYSGLLTDVLLQRHDYTF